MKLRGREACTEDFGKKSLPCFGHLLPSDRRCPSTRTSTACCYNQSLGRKPNSKNIYHLKSIKINQFPQIYITYLHILVITFYSSNEGENDSTFLIFQLVEVREDIVLIYSNLPCFGLLLPSDLRCPSTRISTVFYCSPLFLRTPLNKSKQRLFIEASYLFNL